MFEIEKTKLTFTISALKVEYRKVASRRPQCWTVDAIFTFGRSRMFGHEKLWHSAVDHSRSRTIFTTTFKLAFKEITWSD